MGTGNVLGVLFEISADPSKAEAALGRFRASSASELTNISSIWSSAMRAITGPTALVIGGLVGLGTALFEASKKAADAGTQIYEAAEKTGISAEKLSGLRMNAKLLGENFDSMSVSLMRAGRAIALGLSDPTSAAGKNLLELMRSAKAVSDLGLLPMEDRIATLTKRIFAMTDVGERNRLLMEIFGRGAVQNISQLQMLAEQGYDPAIERAKQFGQYFTGESATKMRQYVVEIQAAKAQLEGLAITLGGKAVPAFTQLMGLVAGNKNMMAEFTAEIKLLGIGLAAQAASATNFFGRNRVVLDALAAQAQGVEDERVRALKRFQGEMEAFTKGIQSATGAFDDNLKKHKVKIREEKSDVAEIANLFRDLSISVSTTDNDYRQYLTTLAQINRFEDEHSKQVLAGLNDERLRQELAKKAAELAKDEKEQAFAAALGIKAQALAIKTMHSALREMAAKSGIPEAVIEMNLLAHQAGVSMEQIYKEAVRVFVLGLPQTLDISREALRKFANAVTLTAPIGVTRRELALLGDQAVTSFNQMAGSAQGAGGIVLRVLGQLGAQILSNIALHVAEAASTAVNEQAKKVSILSSIKEIAIVRAAFEAAKAIACLAELDFRGFVLHGIAAALFGAVGVMQIAAIAGVGFGGGEAAAGGGGAGTAGGTATAAGPGSTAPVGGGQSGPRVQIIFQGPIYGGQAGLEELVNKVSTAVTKRDVGLKSDTSVRWPVRRA